jgi:hypothetical protein
MAECVVETHLFTSNRKDEQNRFYRNVENREIRFRKRDAPA